MTFKIAGYITAYQDIKAVNTCIQAIKNQHYPIDKILIIDNSFEKLIEESENIIVQHCPKNIGISGGLEIGITWAIKNNYDFLWVFDQDSEPSPQILEELIKTYNILNRNERKIGIVSPLPIDKVTGQKWHGLSFNKYRFVEINNYKKDSDFYECDAVITSGSLISIEAAKTVPLPNPNFFIDAVDWEYCMKFRQHDYHIIILKNTILKHRFGNSQQIKHTFNKRNITIYNYSPLRYYYICRNYTYLETRLAKVNRKLIQSVIRRLQFLFVLLIKIIVLEKQLTLLKAFACLKGTYDGFRGKLGKTWSE